MVMKIVASLLYLSIVASILYAFHSIKKIEDDEDEIRTPPTH